MPDLDLAGQSEVQLNALNIEIMCSAAIAVILWATAS